MVLRGDEELYLGSSSSSSSSRAGMGRVGTRSVRRFSVSASMINSGLQLQPSTKGSSNNSGTPLPLLSFGSRAHRPLRQSSCSSIAHARAPPPPSAAAVPRSPLHASATACDDTGPDSDSDDDSHEAMAGEWGEAQCQGSQSAPGDPADSRSALVGWASRNGPGSPRVTQGSLYRTHSNMLANLLRLGDLTLAHSAASAEKAVAEVTQLRALNSFNTSTSTSGGSTPGPGSPLAGHSLVNARSTSLPPGSPLIVSIHATPSPPLSPLAFVRSQSGSLETSRMSLSLSDRGGEKAAAAGVGLNSPGRGSHLLSTMSTRQQQQQPTSAAQLLASSARGAAPDPSSSFNNTRAAMAQHMSKQRRASSFIQSNSTPCLKTLLPKSDDPIKGDTLDSEQAAASARCSFTNLRPRPPPTPPSASDHPAYPAYPAHTGPTTEYISAAAIAAGFVAGRDTQPRRFVSFLEPRPPPQREPAATEYS